MSKYDKETPSARNGDPISWVVLIMMGLVLLDWLSNSAFSPIPANLQGNTCSPTAIVCIGATPAFGFMWTQAQHLMIFVVPLMIGMFAWYFISKMGDEDPLVLFQEKILLTRDREDRDKEEEEEEEEEE